MGDWLHLDLFTKIRRWLASPLDWPMRIYSRIMIMIRYIPIAWHDQDWDWARILMVLQFKIKRTRIHVMKYGHHEDSGKEVEQMKDVEDNIQRILDDDYMMDEIGQYLHKYPPHFKRVAGTSMSEVVHPTPTEEDELAYKLNSQMREMMALNDWKALWTKLERHMMSWWD